MMNCMKITYIVLGDFGLCPAKITTNTWILVLDIEKDEKK